MADSTTTVRMPNRLLADQLIRGEGWTWEVTRVVAGSLLMALCAQPEIRFPWTPVPITLQTFGLMLVAVLLGARRGALALLLYLIEGAAGLPVFAPGGAPGILRFAGPTGGYLLSYPLAAFVTGILVERLAVLTRGSQRTLGLIGALVAGQVVVFAFGWFWLARMTGMELGNAFLAGVAPFLPGDVVKIVLVLLAVRGVELAAPRAEV